MAKARMYANSEQIILRAFSNDPQGQAYMNDLAEIVNDHAQMHAPIRDTRPGRPGAARLYNSFEYGLERRGFFTVAVCRNTAPYAYYVHEGAAPHYITGRLHFFWEGVPGGSGPDQWVKFGRVSHPGIGADSTTPFFRYAAEGLGLNYTRMDRL